MPCQPSTSWSGTTAPTTAFAPLGSVATAWGASVAPPQTFASCCGAAAISAPVNVVATGVSISEIDVTWNAVPGAVSYDVRRAGVVVATGLAVTNFADTGLMSNTPYTYDVRACDASGCSAWSTLVIGVTFAWTGITSRELWLDATAAATLTIATGVSAWADASGNGRSLVQATSTKQPAVVAGLLNSLPGVRFDGVNDFLAATLPVELKNGSTIFAVAGVNFANTTKGHGLFRVISNAIGIQHEPSDDPVVASRSRLETFSSTNAGLLRASPASVTTTGARLITARVSPATPAITLYKNGALNAGPIAGFATVASSVGDIWHLCTDENETIVCGQYDVFELIVFSRALTDAERALIETILLAKWGL